MLSTKAKVLLVLMLWQVTANAQDTISIGKTAPVNVHGGLGITYEGYGLNLKPAGSSFYNARNPWNQARLNFTPNFQFGEWLSVPLNINISLTPTNFAGPWAGIGKGPNKETFWQWVTNPMNSIGINPKYKWAELLLGTQYIKYSDLSTGDVGSFGAGVNLSPGIFRLKYFTGSSQRGINYLPPEVSGSYQRNHWMMQTGIEKEGDYRFLVNFVRGTDKIKSVTSPPITAQPQEGFTYSIVADKSFQNGWYVKSEYARSFFTADRYQPLDNLLDFHPFLVAHTSSTNDEATQVFAGRRSVNWDIGVGVKYMGAGFKSMSYPFMQVDYRDLTLNTRFNLFHDKTAVNSSIGKRTNNVSDVTILSNQLIINITTSTLFNEHFTMDVNYNNTGFQAGSSYTIYGVKNVSNDFTVAPTYTFSTAKITHLFSLSYNLSKYKELLLVAPFTVTDNITHNFVFTYIPTFLQKELRPDFGIVYFNNSSSGIKNRLLTFSSGLGMPLQKGKWQLKGQLQYTIGKMHFFTTNNNFIASLQSDCKLNNKLSWNIFLSSNFYKYGDELAPPVSLVAAHYLETNLRTGFQYQF